MPEGIRLNESRGYGNTIPLQNKKRLKISEIRSTTGIKNATRTINSLMETGIVEIDEKVVERYRPEENDFRGTYGRQKRQRKAS